MCYKAPGPRCSSHARKAFDKATKVYEANKTHETHAAMKEAELEWLGTPDGIQELRDEGWHESADHNEALRQSQIAEFKKLEEQKEYDKRSLLKVQYAASDGRDARDHVANNVARDPKVGAPALAKLAKLSDRGVLNAVMHHPNTAHNTLCSIAKRFPEFETDYIKNPLITTAELKEIAETRPDFRKEMALSELAAREVIRKQDEYDHMRLSSIGWAGTHTRAAALNAANDVARDPKVGPKALAKLAESKDWGVLDGVMHHPNTSHETLRSLVKRLPELEADYVKHPKITTAELKEIADKRTDHRRSYALAALEARQNK